VDLTLILLMCRIWCAPNNASKWVTGFNSAFKGLKYFCNLVIYIYIYIYIYITIILCKNFTSFCFIALSAVDF
jgi:hypothetical protein